MITPSQTVGPFFHRALLRDRLDALGEGDLVRLEGRVLDGDGAPVPDALLEFWRHDPPAFARVGTDDEGRFSIETAAAPYLCVTIHARGLLNHLSTRVYLEEPPGTDPVWQRIPAARRARLLAGRDVDGYRWDIVLQGDAAPETVFFQWQR